MGLKEWWAKQNEEAEQEQKRKNEEASKVDSLLDKFEIPDFEKFFDDVIGKRPNLEYEDEEKKVAKNPLRKEYLIFIKKNLEDKIVKYENIEKFAIKHQIITPNYFTSKSNVEQTKNEFEIIINTIVSEFKPEKIYDETTFEDQLMIFLKAKFPSKKIDRQFIIRNPSERLDILVDDKYAFELKVYEDRGQLRALGAQLEEYKERFSYLCAIILDPKQNETSELDINEYSNKYKTKHNIMTIVLKGIKK